MCVSSECELSISDLLDRVGVSPHQILEWFAIRPQIFTPTYHGYVCRLCSCMLEMP